MSTGPFLDPLGTPARRREVWATIALTLATMRDPSSDVREGAHVALDLAMSEDPPREWPEGSYGHRLLTGAQGRKDPSDD